MNTATITPLLHPSSGARCTVERVPASAPRERFAGAIAQAALQPDTSVAPCEPVIAVHGGYDQVQKSFLTDLHIFCPELLKWVCLPQGASWPSARIMHAVCFGIPECNEDGLSVIPLYLYGGLDRMGLPLSDFMRFDLFLNYTREYIFSPKSNVPLRGEWKQLEPLGDRAPAMAGHSLTVRPCNSDLILFGGISSFNLCLRKGKSTKPEQESFLSTYLYAWSKKSGWRALPTEKHSLSHDVAPPQPCRRVGHSAVITNDKLYIFGGIGALHEPLNDLWEYDFSRESWRQISNLGETISPHWWGSGFLLEERWWVLVSQDWHAEELYPFSIPNDMLRVQAYDTVNEVWASSWKLQHRSTSSKYPLPLFFSVPEKYNDKACCHLKELTSTDDKQNVAFHALSIFTTRTNQHKPALVHVSGSIKQSGFPLPQPPPTVQPTEVNPWSAVHPSATDASIPKAPRKRISTHRTKRTSTTKRSSVKKVAVASAPFEDNPQTHEISEMLSWADGDSCRKEACWLNQFGLSPVADDMNQMSFL
ncbi:hypothetical protein XU18_0505 [Perkinsela sp. CCAP 1560/4]|nr:hypothetical protein XU18_0505 [Perkinsela sp. CCAP 1560/4]|eukprot:KNH09227.1 hypothetical protein XU18_0505 [Perkinsela sp. CCAP 1560/4]